MPGISYRGRPHRGGRGILIRSLSPDDVDEISLDGDLDLSSIVLLYPPADTIPPGGGGAFETLYAVPGGVTLAQAGDVLLEFSATIQVTPAAGSTATEGALFQFLWDGAPLTSNRYFQIDEGAAGVTTDTFAMCVHLEDLVIGAGAGNHTLEVQWAIINPLSTLDFFGVGLGTLKIQGAQ